MGAADVEYVSDNSLLTEFVLVQRIYKAVSNAASNDPFTCALDGGSTPIAALDGLLSHPMLECLDVGAASTLGGLSGVSLNNTESAVLPTSASGIAVFGSPTQCSGKTVSDGLINAYDFAVLMWAQ